MHGRLLHSAHECRAVVETFQVRPDLLDGRLRGVVAQGVEFVDIAGITEGDELGDPALVVASGQFVQKGHTQSTALREDTYRSEAGLSKTRREEESWESPNSRKEQSIHVRGIIHTHTVGSDDTALILVG